MTENSLHDLVRASLDGVRELSENNSLFSDVILTPSGVTVVPVNRVRAGFFTGGRDPVTRKTTCSPAGGASGVSVTPVAFLTVTPDAQIRLIRVEEDAGADKVNTIADLIESSPELIQKIKHALFGG